jgi:hypothetical protein
MNGALHDAMYLPSSSLEVELGGGGGALGVLESPGADYGDILVGSRGSRLRLSHLVAFRLPAIPDSKGAKLRTLAPNQRNGGRIQVV